MRLDKLQNTSGKIKKCKFCGKVTRHYAMNNCRLCYAMKLNITRNRNAQLPEYRVISVFPKTWCQSCLRMPPQKDFNAVHPLTLCCPNCTQDMTESYVIARRQQQHKLFRILAEHTEFLKTNLDEPKTQQEEHGGCPQHRAMLTYLALGMTAKDIRATLPTSTRQNHNEKFQILSRKLKQWFPLEFPHGLFLRHGLSRNRELLLTSGLIQMKEYCNSRFDLRKRKRTKKKKNILS